MIFSVRYPHVNDLVLHYANKLSDDMVISILQKGLNLEREAEHLSYFIWRMLDEMAKDREEGDVVLSGTDNTAMGADIAYEMDTLMEESGFGSIWEKISDEA
ncbi:hypothetical protein [Marinibactrum halimedae]|uniref:Uncharacterized protein n=1 Tax=Marinibactrum halimedae TaxID=1444977 RepID=A0AA37T9X2_9GAMM|nr:hypothetical protein [Marinibactrum halimedae]MCD9458788.1 hypothetical protein [Marinibactrum halimedae]GLS25347.1 hypothetical protein GCM10007877_10610 [Marinibactrum halimedae]